MIIEGAYGYYAPTFGISVKLNELNLNLSSVEFMLNDSLLSKGNLKINGNP